VDHQADSARSNDEDTSTPQPVAEIAWSQFAKTADDWQIRLRFITDAQQVLKRNSAILQRTALLALIRPEGSINTFDLDQIYEALSKLDPQAYDDIVLFLLSKGGQIEPAYQISKICKAFARGRKFIVVVPREAKSAATLIALGADEIHIGPLGQLGPIDPQIGGMPALGVAQSLQSIAALSQQYPGSADMFARYLRLALSVEQIGYYDRVSASAVQYAERLLGSKDFVAGRASEIANLLVYSYKDHGFVIDNDEAVRVLGQQWVKYDSPLESAAEELYKLFDDANFWLGIHQQKYLLVIGQISFYGVFVLAKERAG